jgi:hypothetical protein
MSHVQEIVSYIPLGDARYAVLMHVMLVMGGYLCSSRGTGLKTRWTHKKAYFFPDITFTTLCHF